MKGKPKNDSEIYGKEKQSELLIILKKCEFLWIKKDIGQHSSLGIINNKLNMSINFRSNFYRVMIIDNSQIDKIPIKDVLNQFNFADIIFEHDSAAEALDYLANNQYRLFMLPEIIFADTDMWDMSVFDFVKEFGKLSYVLTNTCRVFIVSLSDINESDLSKLDDKNIASFIKKPLTKNCLDIILSHVY